MSNLRNEQNYETIEEMLDFIFEQQFKKIYTSIPAIVESYNSSTKRANVVPALNRVYTDGSIKSLPVIIDVPVIFPSGGGFTITMPITKGDSVLLVFSQRGLTNFKKTFTQSTPDDDSLLSLKDAVAISGFGALNITPSSSTGATIQGNDGENAVIVESGKVEVKKSSNTLTIDDSQMQASISGSTFTLDASKMEAIVGGATLTLNASSLTSSVPINAPSYSGLSGGAANMTSGINMSSQNITNVADLTTDGGVNLSTHVHVDPQGGTTGTPQN